MTSTTRDHDKDMLLAGLMSDLEKARAEIVHLKVALDTTDSMLGSVNVQLNVWGFTAVVNVRDRRAENAELLFGHSSAQGE